MNKLVGGYGQDEDGQWDIAASVAGFHHHWLPNPQVGMALALFMSPTGLGLVSSGLASTCWWGAGVGKVGSVDAPSSVAADK